ncbi:MAG TPA: hypothetical protein VKB92_01150 [Myxococcales bacterium]|nr:hypothetical protein [Myxococcales bacterium]
MRTLILATLLLAAGCSTGSLGHCNSNSDCPAGATCDPTENVCTVGANDCFPACGAGLTCQSAACVDLSGPDIQIAADPQPYARLLADGGVDLIRLPVTITDPSGVCQSGACRPKLTVGSTSSFFALQEGKVFSFDLDPTRAAAGQEGPLAFTVTAQDSLGHQAIASGSRFIDDKAPAVTLKVFRDGDAEPPSGVGPPPIALNTGHDGQTFLYSDVVHIKGTVADDGGIGDVSWRIDGIAIDGGVSTGASHPICDGGSNCSFDVQVALNAPTNGEFHTGDGRAIPGNLQVANGGDTSIPVGDLQVVLTAADRARTAAGHTLSNVSAPTTAVRTTRFLWLASLPTGSIVSGLAIHPNGDVIATTEGAGTGLADEVFAVPSSGPLPDGGFPLHWTFGLDAGFGTGGLGDIVDMPAIGAGDGTNAPIYVATTDGGVFALSPSGAMLWNAVDLQELWTAPAVVNLPAGEAVVIPSAATPANQSKVFTVGSSNGSVFVLDGGVDDIDLNSAPLVLDGGVYFGTKTSFYRLNLPDGGLAHVSAGGETWSPITDGGVVYTARKLAAAAPLTTYQQSLTPVRTVPVAGGVNQDLIVDMNGRVIASTTTSRLVSIDTADGGLVDVGLDLESTMGDGKIPLQGSDGTIYLPRSMGFLLAFRNGLTSWTFDPSGTIFRAATMDCAGRLYVASGETIYALITDDRGLADAPWPTYRRDSRATGNFGAPKYGVRLPGPDGGVCNN